MADVVEYIVKLKDEMSGKLGGIKSIVEGIGVALAGVFAVEKVIEFERASVEAFSAMNLATGQLNATLQSTGGSIGLTAEKLEEIAEALSKTTLYSKTATVGMESILATFTAVHGEIAEGAIPAIQDLSAKMHQDLQSSAVQVGKALNDPIRGITALRRVGVSFTTSQEEVIKKLAETGHVAEAQAMILKELNTEFGGSARAAYDAATPMEKLKNRIEEMHENFGELFVRIQGAFLPVVEALINGMNALGDSIRNTIEWFKQNKVILETVAVAVGVATAAYLIYLAVTQAVVGWEILKYTWMMRSVISTALLTAAQEALNIIMSMNPIGAVITAIAAFAAGIYYAYQKSETFRAILKGLWYVIKDDLYPILKAYGEIWMGIVTFSPEKFKEGVSDMGDAIKNLANIKRDFTLGVVDSLKESAAAKAAEEAKTKAPVLKKVGGATVNNTALKSESTVTGSKSLNIKIDIREMIGVKNFTSTGSEAMDLKTFSQKVLQVMTTAINDAQIITE